MAEEIAVVITCYNYGKYVGKAIRSCQEQTTPVSEIIVVNDGSSDDSDAVIRSFADSDPRIHYIQQSNQGQAKAKNIGIAASKSALIAFLDGDDWWENNKIALQLPLFNDPKVGVVYSRASYVDENNQTLDITLDSKTLSPRNGYVCNEMFMDNFVPFSSSVVRRTCFTTFGVFDESLKMGIDWDLWLRISTSWHFAFVDEPLLIYRVGHSGQMSKNAEERMRCSDRIMNRFLERYPASITPQTKRLAQAFTWNNRGYFYSHSDRIKAFGFYLRSIRSYPYQLTAFINMLKLILRH